MSTVNELMVIRFLFFIGSRWLRFIEDLDLKKIFSSNFKFQENNYNSEWNWKLINLINFGDISNFKQFFNRINASFSLSLK